MSMSQQTVLLTGAAGGLGRIFANALAKAGYRLVLTDCIAFQAPTGSRQILADLSDPESIRQLATQAGEIDILINNAALMPLVPVSDLTSDLWRRIQAVNVEAPFLLAQALCPGMAKRGFGRVINFASSTVWGPPPGMAAYAASKMGVIGLTRALAAEFGAKGITVNALSPGLTKHEGTIANLPPEAFAGVKARQFIPRIADPEDLVGPLLFLASASSNFVTGQVINADGGGFGF